MITDLTTWVSDRLDADAALSDDAKLLILAALEGKQSLADMAGYSAPAPSPEIVTRVEPVGAFLKQIKVRGFRGIGPEAQLDLDPYPSLTVISGRNGSGKSSFAEALELALTGTTYRWKARAGQWKDTWRNVHDGDPAFIDVTLAEEGVGPTRVSLAWSADAPLDEAATTVQRHGEKKEAGVASLGWAGPLETYRPILTYEEIGALLAAAPSVLYDAISTVLGLGQLADAVKALDDHRKETNAPQANLRESVVPLIRDLADLEDERAKRAATLLGAKVLDIDGLRGLASGTTSDNGLGARLRALLALTLPTEEDCRTAADALRNAVGDLAREGDRIGDHLVRRGNLLTAAIDVHDHEGDQPCPVCAGGALDASRVAALREELADGQTQLTQFQSARARQADALGGARSLIVPPPAALSGEPPTGLAQVIGRVLESWACWAQVPASPLDLADHLGTNSAPSRTALAAMQAAAQALLAETDETWSRIATRIGAHADAAERCEMGKPAAAAATAACAWLKGNDTVLKNERVKPIADEAKSIWAGLRAESNVELAGLTLAGTSTRRHVVLSAEVDGTDAGALAVMSQGELHSLALALFLPRATMADSPFRFVVLDDPVQAMDPAKVDGLVNVLLDIAKTRQVVVFSHDDRFASAVRRARKDVPVKMLEVVREANSSVVTSVAFRPAERYLRDAFGLVKDDELPDETLRRVLPGLLRMALEAQAKETFFGRELSIGASHREVEARWLTTDKTRGRLELGIARGTSIDGWLSNQAHRGRALRDANKIHGTLGRPALMDSCRDVEKTVDDLRNGAR